MIRRVGRCARECSPLPGSPTPRAVPRKTANGPETKPGTSTSAEMAGRWEVSVRVTRKRSRNQGSGVARPDLARSRRCASAVSASHDATGMHSSAAASPHLSDCSRSASTVKLTALSKRLTILGHPMATPRKGRCRPGNPGRRRSAPALGVGPPAARGRRRGRSKWQTIVPGHGRRPTRPRPGRGG